MTISELISQVRNGLKTLNADSRMTDKFIWSIINKHARWLIKREGNKVGALYSMDYLFQTLKCVLVEEVPTIDDACGVKNRCTVFRTKIKLPKLYEGSDGAIIKSVFTIDGSQEFSQISVQEYMRKLENPHTVKYDKAKYFFFNNGYLYFPKSSIRMVMIKGYFEDEINGKSLCECGDCIEETCSSKLEEQFRVPDYLMGELMNQVLNELGNITRKLQEDVDINKNENRVN